MNDLCFILFLDWGKRQNANRPLICHRDLLVICAADFPPDFCGGDFAVPISAALESPERVTHA